MRSLLLLCVTPILMHAGLIANGGFETGDFTGWTVTPAQSGSDIFVTTISSHTGTFAAAFSGSNSGFYDQISQTIATVPGDTLKLDYWLSPFVGDINKPADFFVSWNGTPVPGSDVANLNNGFPFQEYSFDLLATGTSSVVAFSGYDIPNGFFLDDVSLTDTTAVPEPTVLWGLLGAFLLQISRRR